MPKAILEFNLPEEQAEFDTASNAGKMQSILWDLQHQVFRNILKYETSSNEKIQELLKNHPNQVLAVVEAIQSEYFNLLEEYNVDI